MEIRLDRGRRAKGLVAYGLFTAAVGGLLVWVFVRFTASVGIAVGLVGFMLAYMYGMAALASRDGPRGSPDPDDRPSDNA